MATFIEHDGIRWHQRKDGYFASSRRGLLHRYVWEQANGPIPDGWHVHHRNEDKADNRLENLEAITPAEHFQRHPRDSEWHAAGGRRARPTLERICGWCDKPFATRNPAAVACSDKCWHRLRDRDRRGKRWTTSRCAQCGIEFAHLAKNARVVCSRDCRQVWVARTRRDRVRPGS